MNPTRSQMPAMSYSGPRGLFICHIALQGCVRARDVAYGMTADTGGHIKYVLDLVRAAETAGVARQEIIVRRFDDPRLGPDYAEPFEELSGGARIVRIDGASHRYLAKEQLWREHDAMADRLEAHLLGLDRRPDIIHAHYADAGRLAAEMKRRLGIPYIFTAHSLGHAKAGDGQLDADLERRIAIEEEALADAALVVASSQDEADSQYARYANARTERITVIPPGCDLDESAARDTDVDDDAVATELRRFLTDPEKPPVLAIARAVKRKNLTGLVRAFGAGGLRTGANLVIYAGCRDDVRQAHSGGCGDAGLIEELLYLVDRYDLWGSVALPKRHDPRHVFQIYRYAAARGGVFANVATSEPFGLTLLEAAAAGLPVVATQNGGPRDIVGDLGNGVLVDPADTNGIASAIGAMLTDRSAWERYAANGRAGVANYSWRTHADTYVSAIRRVTRPAVSAQRAPRIKRLLVSDIDNTLTGCRRGLTDFAAWRMASPSFGFAIATGRTLPGAVSVLAAAKVPTPSVLVTAVGSEIYYVRGNNLRDVEADGEWARRVARDWDRRAVEAALAGLPGLERQPAPTQRPFKVSFFTAGEDVVARVEETLAQAGLPSTVIHSHGNHLDILPANTSKGDALAYLAERFEVDRDDTIAAGDSGNDIHMLKRAGFGIIVANHAPELRPLVGTPNTYLSARRCAGGIVEGIAAFTARAA